MEDQTQSGAKPQPEILKIRTMQDDLKKPAGPAPVIPAPQAAPAAQFSSPAKPTPAPQSATAARTIPEPPTHLPGAVISSSEPQRPIAAPTPPGPVITPIPSMPPARPVPPPPAPKPAPTPTPISPKPTLPPMPTPKPVFAEPIKKPVPPPLTPQPTGPSAGSGLFKKLAIGAAVVLIIAIGAYFFWPKETPLPPPIEPPASLISADSTSIIEIKNETELTNELSKILAVLQSPKTLKYLPIKITDPSEEFLSLEKFLNTMAIGLPPEIAARTDGKYSLFSYSQESSGSPANSENRFVLVISLSSPASRQDLKTWEPKMLKELELLYSSLPDDLPSQIKFADSARKDISPHRFANFGSPDLSLDYALAGNLLIVATSKQSMDKALNALINK